MREEEEKRPTMIMDTRSAGIPVSLRVVLTHLVARVDALVVVLHEVAFALHHLVQLRLYSGKSVRGCVSLTGSKFRPGNVNKPLLVCLTADKVTTLHANGGSVNIAATITPVARVHRMTTTLSHYAHSFVLRY